MGGVTKAERICARRQLQPLDEHELDLFLGAAPVEDDSLAEAEASAVDCVPRSSGDSSSDVVRLMPGMVLLRGFLQPREQQEMVDAARALGLDAGGFYKPTYASGAKCRLHQMCLGRHWNVVTEQYEASRSNFDSALAPPLPPRWAQLVVKSVEAAREVDPRVLGECDAFDPDICVVNYYKKAGRNGLHVDKDESARALALGSPVVSFSIGCAAEFAYADHYPSESGIAHEAVPVVRLESGDVLVFGGPSRQVVHALTRVFAHTQPAWLHMRPGRLNLTFREYEPGFSEPQ